MDTLPAMPRTPRQASAPHTPTNGDPQGGGAASFEAEAKPVLTNLRNALAALIRTLPGPVERPIHLQRQLDLTYSVSWQLFQVAQAKDPLAAGTEVPRRRGMARFLEAATKRGVKPSAIARVRAVYATFEALVTRHAGE